VETTGAFLLAWQAGNMVALIRHTERCDHSDNLCFDGDKGITVVGRDVARQLGEFFTQLPDVDQQIYTSPVKRTAQTARFIFGDNHSKADWLGRACKNEMYDQVLSNKKPGENLFLVTHSNCIMDFGEADGRDLVSLDLHDFESYGIVFFFSMGADLRGKGHLLPSDWPVFLTAIRSQL
ncbi:MAG: histidine phosphatase family protein, partial [Pseudomonadales bacterium]